MNDEEVGVWYSMKSHFDRPDSFLYLRSDLGSGETERASLRWFPAIWKGLGKANARAKQRKATVTAPEGSRSGSLHALQVKSPAPPKALLTGESALNRALSGLGPSREQGSKGGCFFPPGGRFHVAADGHFFWRPRCGGASTERDGSIDVMKRSQPRRDS